MSHQDVQRVVVRMLYDPAFADRIAQDASGLGLSEAEQGWLRAIDRRAWGVDPLRRARTLKGLFDEFKGSCTLHLAATGKLAALDAFFSSEAFHDCVQQRGSMDRAFARFLHQVGDERVRALAALEGAMARARRELELRPERLDRPPSGAWVARAPGVAAGAFDGAVLALLNRVERWLFEAAQLPALALVDDGPELDALPLLDPAPLHLVIRPIDGAPVLAQLGVMVATTLSALERPTSERDAITQVAARGLGAERAAQMFAHLEREGLLTRG